MMRISVHIAMFAKSLGILQPLGPTEDRPRSFYNFFCFIDGYKDDTR